MDNQKNRRNQYTIWPRVLYRITRRFVCSPTTLRYSSIRGTSLCPTSSHNTLDHPTRLYQKRFATPAVTLPP